MLAPGDTLYIRGGTYAETLDNTIPSGTSWSAPITVAAYSGETAIIKPISPPSDAIIYFDFQSYVILKNLVVDGSGLGVAGIDGVKITYQTKVPLYANHIRFQGCEIRNAPENGILITTDPSSTEHVYYNEFLGCLIHNNGYNTGNGASGHGLYSQSSFCIIDGNKIYDNAGYGIHLYNSDSGGTADDSNNIVRNNLVFDNSQKNDGSTQSGNAGIGLFDGANNLCYNNIVYGNAVGIVTGYGDSGTLIYNNTITGNGLYGGAGGISIGGTSSNSHNDIVRNNISYANNGASDYVDMGAATTADHNLFGVNPLFVNSAANNFHLQAGSPAIDAGITLAQVPVDFDGVTRPQGKAYDIGAYELPVNSVVASHLQIVAPSTSTAGSSFSITVTAQDANNNTLTSYLGTIHFTNADASAVVPSGQHLCPGQLSLDRHGRNFQ